MPLILPGNVASATAGAYEVANSLMIEGGDSASLSRTFGTPSDAKKWTFSTWYKSSTSGTGHIFGCGTSSQTGSGHSYIGIVPNFYAIYYDGSTHWNLISNSEHKDVSAWAHYIFVFDSANGTANSRIKQYVNGAEVTSFGTRTNPSVNYSTAYNNNSITHYIGARGQGGTGTGGQYFAETAFFDGQAYTPNDLGEFDDDTPTIWKPKDISGLTFGNNGFYCEYKQTGTSANSSGMGADTSGNDNHFTVTNLAAIDQATDSPTNNFCTLNSLNNQNTLSQGNLKAVTGSNTGTSGTIGVSSGLWYYEVKVDTAGGSYPFIGFVLQDRSPVSSVGGGTALWVGNGGLSDGDIVGLALDLNSNTFRGYINGSILATSSSYVSGSDGTITSGLNWIPALSGVSSTFSCNFGNPSFTISSSVADKNGYGSFEYDPGDYLAICTKNLGSDGG